MITLKPSKLNKSQLAELASSAIPTAYATLNFCNITKRQTEKLLKVTSEADRALKGTALEGGWASHDLKVFKPKKQRALGGKYESVYTGLSLIKHPDGVEVNQETTYICEGYKKAVAVAAAYKCVTYAVQGLSHFLGLMPEIETLPGMKRIVLDNDNSINAVNLARKVVKSLPEDCEVAIFKGFKGIDDAFAAGIKPEQIQWIPKSEWQATYQGYVSGSKYQFSSPQFPEISIPESKKLVAIDAAKGSGKTWFAEWYTRRARSVNKTVIGLSHRINLSAANSKRLNIAYIDDASYQGGSVALVVDSICKVKFEDCIGAIFFIDEICQVLDHLIFSDTLKYKRAEVFDHLRKCLEMATATGGQILIADADLDDKAITLVKSLAGVADDDIFTIQNTYIFNKGFAYSCQGVKSSDGKVRPLDVVAKLLEAALDGKRCYVALSARKASSKFSTTVIEELLIMFGVAPELILRIDAETISDPNHAAYKAATRINELCERYQIILASPSLGTGVDIQYRGFDYVFGIFSGRTDANSARQALARVRDTSVQRFFYASEKIYGKEKLITSDAEIADLAKKGIDLITAITPTDAEEISEFRSSALASGTKEYFLRHSIASNAESHAYRAKICQGLMAEGYHIERYQATEGDFDSILSQLIAIASGLLLEDRTATQNAERIDEEKAKLLFKETAISKEEKHQIDAWQIRNQLGQEPTVEIQIAIDNGDVTRLENQFKATEGFDTAFELWKKEEFFAKKSDKPEVAGDFVKRSLKMQRVSALRAVDFFEFINKEFTTEQAKKKLEELGKDALNRKIFAISKDSVKCVKNIAAMFNYRVDCTRKTKKDGRIYQGFDLGLMTTNGCIKGAIVQHWKEKGERKLAAWESYKADYRRIKRAEVIDEKKNLVGLHLTEELKYTRLSTRARTLPMPEMPGYRMVCTANVSEFTQWLASQPEMAVDIETYGVTKAGGLDHIYGQIRLIQFATESAIWVLEKGMFDSVRSAIKQLLGNPNQRKIGHNFMFDLRFLRKEFGVIAKNCADTMLGAKCLMGDMGAAKILKFTLKDCCHNFLGIEVDKTEQNSDWGDTLSLKQIEYAAKDPWLTSLLYKRLEALCKKPSILLLPFPEMMAWEAWEVENRFLFAAQQMEDTGYEIDTELLAKTKAQYQSVRDELAAKWDAPFAPTQKAALMGYLNEKYGLSLKSLGKATAAENKHIPEILLMQQICAIDALMNAVIAIETQVAFNNGCVKPVFQILTGTGRTSSGSTKINKALINLQSLAARVNPVLKDFDLPLLKALFKTDLIIDLPASHGRISAELGNDANALAAYMDESIDLHCGTAAAVGAAVFPDANLTAEWIQANKKTGKAKGLRDTAKNTYYGWLNGAGVMTIQKQIKSNLQIDAEQSLCKKALEGLQSVFSGTTEYAKAKLKELEANQFIINGVICGWMEVAGQYLCWKLGRVGQEISVPATKAFAGIWSRAEATLMKKACSRIAEEFAARPEWESKLQNFIHDEINAVIGCPDAAEFAHSVVREEFGKICHRTVIGFDPLAKCYPLQNWSDK